MKTVKDACILQDNALTIRVSDQIEQLDELIGDEAAGRVFFEKTHITQGMNTLVTEAIARLAGKSTQAIFHLKQAMGGGKTHLLVGLGLLAKHAGLRKSLIPGVPGADAFGAARIAAFNGRNSPEEFFWGEIAKQLGRGDVFKRFWVNGPEAPGESDWLALFDGGEPTLLLLDEIPPYFEAYATKQLGAGTVADVVTRAFANMLTAAGKRSNVCVVVSDLAASYQTGAMLINRALSNAQSELGRQERSITPVDLASDEVYAILRKRLFKRLPDVAEIEDVAAQFGKALEIASRANVAARGAEADADEIAKTYPFHPRLKDLIALFKDNQQFKQTRGLLELVSHLLRSVWQRKGNDVHLIGAQHFDLADSDVRNFLASVSNMPAVISKDIWDATGNALTQRLDIKAGTDAAAQLSSLLLTASLSTAVNATRGLTRADMAACLVTPLRQGAECLKPLEGLEDEAWYLHHTSDEQYYFDRTENLTKMLQGFATDAPENKVEELIRHKLTALFKPTRKLAYDEVLPLPRIDEIAERVRRGRVLLIISPESALPPKEIDRLFASIAEKNNFCILTGDQTHMASVDKAARHVFAAQKADSRIPKGHAQREDLEQKQRQYDHEFTNTVLAIFDKVCFPYQRAGDVAKIQPKALNGERDASRPYNGEEQIEKTLIAHPRKLYPDIEQEFDALRDRAEALLWPPAQDDTRSADMADRAACESAMPWLPPKGLDALIAKACQTGLWEDLGNGALTKKPRPKKAVAQVVADGEPNDQGEVRLRISTQYGGPAPRVYYVADSAAEQVFEGDTLTTKALRLQLRVVDPSNKFETGDPVVWQNKLVVRSELVGADADRSVVLTVAPRGAIRYTTDGSEPRNGTAYDAPVRIGKKETRMLVFAEADGIEAKQAFDFARVGDHTVKLDPAKPAALVSPRAPKKLDSRTATYNGLKSADDKGITFESVTLTIGTGSQSATITVGEIVVTPAYIESVLEVVLQQFESTAPITLQFRKAHCGSGHDLQEFATAIGITLAQTDIQQ